MESSMSTQVLGCCFWAMGYLKREAISKCSYHTHETLSYLVWMWCCCVCTLWCDNMFVQIQSLVGQYTFTGMADMYSIFSHAYSEEVAAHHIYQDPFSNHWIPDKKKIQSAPREKTNIYVCSSRIRNRKEWTSLQFQVEKDSKELMLCSLSPQSLGCMCICNDRSHLWEISRT